MHGPELVQPEAGLTRLRVGVRHLFPGYFALVMATGIVSTAVRANGAAGLSAAMLVVAIICYLALIVLYGWRFASYRPEFLAALFAAMLASFVSLSRR